MKQIDKATKLQWSTFDTRTYVGGREAPGSVATSRTQERTARKHRYREYNQNKNCCFALRIPHLGFWAIIRAVALPVAHGFLTNGFALGLSKIQ